MKKLEKMTVRDILMTDEYRRELRQVMNGEEDSQRRASQKAKAKGMRLQRTPLDALRDKGAWEPHTMVDCFGCVLGKSLTGFSAREREYIHLVGMTAYKRLVHRLKDKENNSV